MTWCAAAPQLSNAPASGAPEKTAPCFFHLQDPPLHITIHAEPPGQRQAILFCKMSRGVPKAAPCFFPSARPPISHFYSSGTSHIKANGSSSAGSPNFFLKAASCFFHLQDPPSHAVTQGKTCQTEATGSCSSAYAEDCNSFQSLEPPGPIQMDWPASCLSAAHMPSTSA